MKQLKAEFLFLFLLISCQGPYSALGPAGSAARTISGMFWWLCGAGLAIWLLFVALELYAILVKPGPHDLKKTRLFVIGGGVIFPVIIITISIYFSLAPLPDLVKMAPKGSVVVKVSGLQWWWRVKYPLANDQEIEVANEIWLPVNEPVQFLLSSEDVIHSFWVPSLAGKIDMIPGQTNHLSFTPTKTGHYLGSCAEFCGTSHALMRLDVIVVERNVFDEWLKKQERSVKKTGSPGETAFVSNGCISCHTVRGISSLGKIGPDLTHVGSRKRIGSGILNNDANQIHRWIDEVDLIKPEAKMPSFKSLPIEERKALAKWLEGLK